MKIVIVDYGVIGNIFSLEKALKLFADKVVVSSDARDIAEADALVLPGVGAFKAGMEGIQNAELGKPLKSAIESGVPILGICLGAQLLMESSEEMGQSRGLGAIEGSVVPLVTKDDSPVPHTGWSSIYPQKEGVWKNTILKEVRPNDEMYFVHSFVIDAPRDTLALCDYGGLTFTAAVKRDNIYALQFHPEKSGKVGLSILKDFVKLIK